MHLYSLKIKGKICNTNSLVSTVLHKWRCFNVFNSTYIQGSNVEEVDMNIVRASECYKKPEEFIFPYLGDTVILNQYTKWDHYNILFLGRSFLYMQCYLWEHVNMMCSDLFMTMLIQTCKWKSLYSKGIQFKY